MSRSIKSSLLRPLHPERVCWGCDKNCRADDLTCGNDTVRTPHLSELFGDDWMEWSEEHGAENTIVRLFPSEDPALASPDEE